MDAIEIESCWRNAQAYDWENAGVVADLDFWTGVLDRHRPARVAELACGTGRLTFPMAEAGLGYDPTFRIVGLDYSPEMLALARIKLEGASDAVRSSVEFVEGNMRDLPLEGQFDLIFCGFNSFAFLHALDDQLACLSAVRDHLAPGGLFALDLVVPHLAYLEEAESPVPLVRIEVDGIQPAPGVARVRRSYADRYNAATQAIATSYEHEVYFENGRQDRWIDDLTWRMIFPRELELLLRVAGLAPLERHGSYDLAPFGPQSHQYLWLMGAADPR